MLLIRHGETERKSSERYWGATDVPLSALGLEQAARLRDRLATEEVDAVYSSDLSRARVTAETIAAGHRLPVTSCQELREIDFGELEGLTFAEIDRLYPEVTELWKKQSLALKFPGGETLVEFDRRVGQFMGRLAKHAPGGTIVVAAHHGTLCALLCRLLGLGLEHRWQFRLELASLSIVETYSPGGILTRLNDISHLDGL
jgi:alpha-ribazole phosphatase